MSRSPSPILAKVGTDLPFVDREEQLALLKNLFVQATGERGQVAFVTGEGGIGKTRLVQEFGRYAKDRGAIFAVGRSYEEEAVIPYSPWIEIIRAVVRTSPRISGRELGASLAEIGRLVPEMARRAEELGIRGWVSGSLAGGFVLTSDAERVRLFQSVTDLFTYASRESPLVIFLDDIQWADAASLQLLHYFCRRLGEQRTMVVATYRDVELPEDHPLSRFLLDLNRERMLRKIGLTRMTTEEVAQIISNHLGGGPVAAEFSRLVYSRTGGNPFFVEEVLRTLVEDKRIHESPEGWTLKEIEQVEIPSTVRALIKQRLSRLDKEAVQVLSFGSTVGMDFDYELLKRIADIDEEQLISRLEKCLLAGLIKERRSTKQVSYVFADEQIREFLYDEQSIVRKRKVHGKVAHAMEEIYKNRKDRHFEELANHYVLAGEGAKAIEFSLMAADRATTVHAHAEAKKHFTNVLELLGEEQANERLAVLAKIGDASFRMGEYQECVEYYREAITPARELNQNRQVAQLYSRLGRTHWVLGNDREQALKHYKEGLRVLKQEEETSEEAEICQNIARLLVNTGEVDDSLQWCERAIKIAKNLENKEVLADALQTFALGLRPIRDDKAKIFHYLEDSLRICVESGLQDVRSRAENNLAQAYSTITGDYASAKESYVKGIEFAKARNSFWWEGAMETGAAFWAHIPLGEWDTALKVADHSFRLALVGGPDLGAALISLAVVNLCQGSIDGAEDCLVRAYPIIEKSQLRERMYPLYLAFGRLHIRKGDFEKAEKHLLSAAAAGSEFGWTSPPIEAYFELANLYCVRKDWDRARKIHEKLRSGAEELDEKWGYAYELWASGLLASAKQEWDNAKEALKKSSQIWSELKHPYNFAQTTYQLGRVLLESGESDEARERIEEARSVFSRLGASLDLTRIGRLSD